MYKNGFLTKQGGSYKSWKRRWFRIHESKLSYYHNVGDQKPIKTIDLIGAQVSLSKKSGNRQFMFEIKTPKRTYYLNASSDDDRTDWIKCLNRVINHYTKNKQ